MVNDIKPHSCLTSFLGELGFEILGGWTAKNKSVGGQVAKPANLRGELQLKHNTILMGWFGRFGLVGAHYRQSINPWPFSVGLELNAK
jgi:hypothetical protein